MAIPEAYRKWGRRLAGARLVLPGVLPAQGFLGDWTMPECSFTLGGLAAVPAGECASEVSSGFCSGGLYANGPGSAQGEGGVELTGVPPAAEAGAEAAAAVGGAALAPLAPPAGCAAALPDVLR
jgi:hypothetical protein